MKKYLPIVLAIMALFFASCGDDEEELPIPDATELITPETYTFERDGASTVSFPGQTQRILMGEALINAMLDFDTTTAQRLLDMYSNDNEVFASEDLNTSTRQIRNTVASSEDYFTANTAGAATIRQFFEDLMIAQIDEVFPAQNVAAAPGVAGQIADGTSTRYVNAQGLEYDQAVNKGLIGALMIDQMVNNYLSPTLLDAGTNRADNDNNIPRNDNGTDTQMEHFWDEAYGYAYGTAADLTNPNLTIGEDDSFLNKYIGRVEGDSDFTGIAADIFDAFALGRAAIVAKEYEIRDAQTAILRELLSTVIGIRSVYYLQQGKNGIEANDFGAALHDFSEGYGFIYSLQFTQNPATNAPYFSAEEVQGFLDQLTAGNGFWDLTSDALDELSETIAARFTFTVAAAAQVD